MTTALTIGDPNGIGPEIAVKAAAACVARGTGAPLLVGDEAVIRWYAERYAAGVPLTIVPVEALAPAAFKPGTIDAAAGAATVAYVKAALDLVQSGRASAIVAAPHSETAIHAAGIEFSGYPSLVARLMRMPQDRVFLMLVGGGLRIVHATLHERLHDALARLTIDLVEAATLAAVDAVHALGVDDPRIGLFGINPHAGEGGLFGDDDERITAPAADRLRAAGYRVEGPFGADVLLAQRVCDFYVAAYHDQGHVPVKLLAPRDACALTIGGGILFSSVGHGSAFDIAGQGRADSRGVLRALDLVANAATTNHVLSPPPSKETRP